MICKERTPIKCSCSLRSLVGFDISEAQAMTLVGIPLLDRRNNDNNNTLIGTIDVICYEKDLVYMTLYSYWLPEIYVDENGKFQSFSSVSFEIKKFETENKFPVFFEESKWYDRRNRPQIREDIIVRDMDGKEYDNHYWTGHAYYSYVLSKDGRCDAWPSDVDIVEWRYKD